jgi:subtilase family serine protease
VHSILKATAFFLSLGTALGAYPQVKAVNRITQAIDDRETVQIRGSVHPLLQRASDQGRMDGGTTIEGASLVFRRTVAQDAAVEKLLREQQDPSSENYHKWLTPEQYADLFGLSVADINKVTSWLQAQGFTVNRVARGRNMLWFTGTVSQIETVFRTEMHHYRLNGESHYAMAVEPAVPAALGDVVLGVHNVSSFRPKARVHYRSVPADQVKANFTSNLSGNHYLIPADFAKIYDVPTTSDGTGQKIAIVGQSAVNNSDLSAFRSAANLPALTVPPAASPNFIPTLVPNTGASTVVSGDVGESSLDLEWAEGVAKGVTEIFVYTGKSPNTNANVFDAFIYAINQNLAPIISSSYGNCEQNLPAAFLTSLQNETQKANLQGQTMTAAAGDFGAADCDANNTLPAQGGLGVDIPGSLPYVTSVGGTEFNGDAAATVTGSCAAATPYWAQSCSQTSGGSALQYIPEVTWNDTSVVNLLSATGGGASLLYSKPSWQTGTGVPADGERDVPDVALAGSPNHDGYLLCVTDTGQLPCSSGFRDTSGNLDVAGGTSFGAPSFAGIVAIVNQKNGFTTGQGNINPTLYALAASTPSAFHDITSGNNIVPCQVGTTDCTTGTYGYNAGTGYDLVTGLGTPDVANMANNWTAGNPTKADFTMFGDKVGIAAAGGGGSSTITVDARNGYSGTINFMCTAPTSAKIGCTVNGPVTLGGATTKGTVTLSITTTKAGLAPGSVPSLWYTGSGAVFAGVLIFGVRGRRQRWAAAATLLALALVAAAVGCGGSSSSGGGGGGTPVGNYTITVTGNDGTTSHSTSVLVSVL